MTVPTTESIKALLRADAECERIALFWRESHGAHDECGEAINERGELYSWWRRPSGHLGVIRDTQPLLELEICDPEYQRARAEVGLP